MNGRRRNLYIISYILLSSIVLLTRYRFGLREDPALYLYSGIQMANGRLTYKYVWDIKPPAIHETVAIVAYIFDNNQMMVYLILVILTGFSILITIFLIADITKLITGNETAATIAGLSALTYTPFLTLWLTGPYTKYFTATFTLLAIWFYLKNNQFLTGTAATLAVGYWQIGVIVPIAIISVLGIETRKNRSVSQDIIKFMRGILLGILILIFPFLIGNGMGQMLSQTVFAPTVAATHISSPLVFSKRFGLATCFLILGGLGLAHTFLDISRNSNTNHILISSIGIGYFVLALFAGQTGEPDLIPLATVFCIGIGMLVANSRLNEIIIASQNTAKYTFLLIIGGTMLFGLLTSSLDHTTGEIAKLYWSGETIPRCHIRKSTPELNWIRILESDINREMCEGNLKKIILKLFS